MQHNRNTGQFRGQTTRHGDVTAHAEHHMRTHFLQHFARLYNRFE